MSDILEILARDDGGLASLLKSVLLDSEGKVPADRLRIVGALADGAVMESGENANGYYVKLADGTLICYGVKAFTFAATLDYQEIIVTLPVKSILSTRYGFPAFIHHTSMPGSGVVLLNQGPSANGAAIYFGFLAIRSAPNGYTESFMPWGFIGRWK